MKTANADRNPPTASQEAGVASLRILVLAGGPSAEREVSLNSGNAIAAGLKRRGHQVTVRDISPSDLAALDGEYDVIFPALHGTFGEDGALQTILEQRNLRFVGCGSKASATAMDKWETKQLALRLGLTTAHAQVIDAKELAKGEPQIPDFGLPLVVKPVDQGSSVATFLIKQPSEFAPAVAEVVRRFGRALVEQFVPGKEIAVGVVGGKPLPVIWIQPKRAFYDYAAKYQDTGTEYHFETGLAEAVVARLQRDSVRMFEALGCRHLSRVDWIVPPDGAPRLLEVNTLPGFTSHSLVPQASAKAGVAFDELVDRLARMGLEPRV